MFSIGVDISGALKQLNNFEANQLPFALSKSLNELAFGSAKKELPKAMDSTFEGGATAWTKRGFRYQKATKKQLVAIVHTARGTHDYLKLQVEGGIRTPKRSKILVPTKNTRLNKYGNISKAQRNKFDNKSRYFVGVPKGQTVGLGVWERRSKGKKIRKIASLIDSQVHQPTFDPQRPIEIYVSSRFEMILTKHLISALKSAR